MNSTIELLFHLDIPIDFYNKLNKYYYIPENKITILKPGGYIYFIDKYTASKNIYYLGILTKIDNELFYFKQKDSIQIQTILNKYHIFYKPQLNKMNKAIEMLTIINKTL